MTSPKQLMDIVSTVQSYPPTTDMDDYQSRLVDLLNSFNGLPVLTREGHTAQIRMTMEFANFHPKNLVRRAMLSLDDLTGMMPSRIIWVEFSNHRPKEEWGTSFHIENGGIRCSTDNAGSLVLLATALALAVRQACDMPDMLNPQSDLLATERPGRRW